MPGLFKMMYRTRRIYHEIAYFEKAPEARFDGEFPQSRFLEAMRTSWPVRIAWGAAFAVFYYFFATAPWQWLLLPGHWIMGAMHGAIVNWGGHRYGYRNFDLDDVSRNTIPVDFLAGGELLQNNHHKYPMSPNFAARWFELDTTCQVMRFLNWAGVIDTSQSPRMRYSAESVRAARRATLARKASF